MKLIIYTIFLISNLTLFSQSNNFDGDYHRALGNDEKIHFIEYKLTLNQDGTFIFHSYSNNKKGIPPEVNKYGKGRWIAKDKVITFSSNKQKDFDEKYTLDFNNSKARFVTKHPRDKTDQIIKTKLQFFESEIFWIETIDIFKL
ncbi:MAG: copper resistance protein NlpE N-terminal domain-containing protein [Maribacter sp.]